MSKTRDYEMKDYGKKSCFASFLPGIAGMKGIPIWCYYVNRGQGVVSFGVDHKDHAIMEFYPAHVAYQNVKRTGFRTFLRVNGAYGEAFSNEENPHAMTVGMNALTITEELHDLGLAMEVKYITLPEETVGALVRKVTICNCADKEAELELLDGMPAVIPYGVGMDSMKNMTQTAKAWMQVEQICGVSYYRVRASMDDTASVSMIDGGNFAFALQADGARMDCVWDPEAIFAYDNSLEKPVNFLKGGLKAVAAEEQNCSNLLPSAFFTLKKRLVPGQSLTFYELIGQVENPQILGEFLAKELDGNYFESKMERAEELVNQLTATVTTKTGNAKFDAYTSYTYMDNVLRGGFPIPLGHNKIFYVYSRKHGDLERDYNYFAMAPEFYSQGNGNFRDVNQNRRLDTFFAPFVGRENIHLFYSLIQLDGYNPLGIEKLRYHIDAKKAQVVLDSVAGTDAVLQFLAKPFTPGSLYRNLCENLEGDVSSVFTELIDFAEQEVNGNFGEGYWSDHWDYNLDLIEEYLSVFPEEEEDMLYEKAYGFFLSQANINPRAKRYAITDKGIRQYYALDESSKRKTADKQVRAEFGEGAVIKTTLMEKLILLCATKFATLDPYGMGVEMEGGKPGWYDALNGLPGMLGSSMPETYELARNLDYTIGALMRYSKDVELQEDLYDLLEQLGAINMRYRDELAECKGAITGFWNEVNDAKEAYRAKTYAGISGKTKTMTSAALASRLLGFRNTVEVGIEKAIAIGKCPTYFTYNVTNFQQDEDGIHPLDFAVQQVPLFLEGPVRFLKLEEKALDKRSLYNLVKDSDLYDDKLSMYKVNASLEQASYELGRCRSFTPGWLENESIWLHMEYKYLLEVLKSGLYPEFAEDFKAAAVPFLSEETYGRSVLENSSFLASSKNPNKKIHGKGFVARLSGSTIEFLSMWKIMMFGQKPFTMEESELTLKLAPAIPSYLIGEDKTVAATFLGKCLVTYHLPDTGDFFPGNYHIESMQLVYKNKAKAQINGGALRGRMAEDLRNGLVQSMEVRMAR